MTLSRNLLANFLGQGWAGLIGLIFIPFYIRFLGIEAYGLIGIFAVLQAWLVLLDMGMAPTLNREMARFTAGAHTLRSIRDLLRSAEIVVLTLSALLALALWAAAPWLASGWLRAERLPSTEIEPAIAIMGGVVALRLVEGIYRGALLGMQKQVMFNLTNSILATVRAAGAVAVLAWIAPTIGAFFIWQGLVSLVSVVVLAAATYRSLPAAASGFSWQALLQVRRFAGGMMATMFLSLLLTQVDKVLLSRLLSLEDFGYYTLAYTVTAAMVLLVNPVSQTFYPRFSELVATADKAALVGHYHRSAQLVTALVAPAAMLLLFFGREILAIWTGDPDLADRVAPLLAVLALGTWLNGVMHIPYMMQLAHGWPGLAVKLNLAAAFLLVPAILWATPRYGAMGAAIVWLVLNSGYVLIGIQLMHRRLLVGEKWNWYVDDFAKPSMAAMGVVLVCKSTLPAAGDEAGGLVWLAACAAFAYAATVIASPCLRSDALALFRGRINR